MDPELLKKLLSKKPYSILGALKILRGDGKSLKPTHKLNTKGFNTIISFLKMPNPKIMSYTLSILANYATQEEYRKKFKSSQVFHDLTLIMKTVAHPDISSRSWRLVGNLASASEFCFIFLNNYYFEKIIIQHLDNLDLANDETKSLIFRAIGKFCSHRKCVPMLPLTELILKILKHLKSNDSNKIKLSLKLLSNILLISNNIEIDKNLIIRLIELVKIEEYHEESIRLIYAIIERHHFSFEGTGIVDLFIYFLKEQPTVSRDVLMVFNEFGKESAVRNRLKVEGLLPKFAANCRGEYVLPTLKLFSLFSYDIESIEILAQCPNLLSTLIEYIRETVAASLLLVIARSLHHNEFLVTKENLHLYASHESCRPLVLTLIRDPLYSKSVILSGIVWQLFEKKWVEDRETMDALLSKHQLIKHYVFNGTDEQKKTMALLVPFLVTSPQLYTFLYDYGCMEEILDLLDSGSNSVLAAVAMLAEIFGNFQSYLKTPGSHLSLDTMSIDTGYCSGISLPSGILQRSPNAMDNYEIQDLVTFVLDDEKCVTASKPLLCSNSPVFNSMLNGSFAEANKLRVRLKDCSSTAFAHLVKFLLEDFEPQHLEVKLHLDLIAMSDRFLFSRLSEKLLESFKLTVHNHSDVFQWACNAGQTVYSTKLRTSALSSILQSRRTIKAALQVPENRSLLMDDIKQYLISSLDSFQSSTISPKKLKI